MRHWLSRGSTQAKIGMVTMAVFVGFAVGASRTQPVQHDTKVRDTPTAQRSAADTVDMSEKPKISVTKTEVVTTEEEVPFATMQTYDGTLPKDTSVVRVEGRAGKKVVKTEIRIKDGVEVGRALISEEITVPPVTKVVAIGTKTVVKGGPESSSGCLSHYSPCIKKTARALDCTDIGFQVLVRVTGEDPLGLDRDGDGVGCENYPEP